VISFEKPFIYLFINLVMVDFRSLIWNAKFYLLYLMGFSKRVNFFKNE